jgi:hypothetical protein
MVLTGLFSILILAVFFICLPITVGIYVYRDAKSRHMNAPLWTLISILAPALTGFIIYLLVRGSYPNTTCPSCGTPVSGQFVSCPRCGAKLKAACPNCHTPVEESWHICPMCGSVLPEQMPDYTPPVQKKDRTLGKILLAVLIVPILLLGAALLAFGRFSSAPHVGGAGVTSLPASEYLQEVPNPQIEQWLAACANSPGQTFVLRHESLSSQGEKLVRYLIYMPQAGELPQISIQNHAGLFGDSVTLDVRSESGDRGNTLILASFTGDPSPKLKLSYGGQPVDFQMTEVDYPLGLTDNAN